MPPADDMEIISEQLDLLVNYHALATVERDNILEKLKELKKEPDKFKEYSEAISKGLPGVTKGVIGAIDASKSGDPYAISIAAVDIFAGVVTMAGPLLGPVGALASALASMVSTILGQFLPKPPSLKEQLTELLNKFLAEEKLRTLGTALDEIWVLSDTIQHHNLAYKPLNLQHGPEIKAIDDAWQWLKEENKQSVPEWDQVLEKTCMVWIQLLRCVALSVAKPSTRPGVAKDEMLVYLPARQELFLKYLRLIKPVAQERGLYVCMAAWENFGNVLYVAVSRKGDLPWSYKKNTGWMRNFSINVPREQLGSSTPRYDVFTCEDRPTAIARRPLDSVSGDLYDGVHVMFEGHEYPNIEDGVKRRFSSCVSAWTLPAWDDPKAIRVYTAHQTPSYCYVNIHRVYADNSAKRHNWEPHTLGGLEHIRAVYRDISKSLPDDPDAAAMPSRPYEIIYGGYRGNPKIWVELDNSWTDVPSPWEEYNGIEVDPYCLWVFGTKGLACATHASVIQCKNGKLPSPRWITFNTGWEDGFNVRSLCPCADGTLVVGSDQPRQHGLVTWTPTYKINLKERRIDASHWDRRGGSPKQIQKMQIPCWPVFVRVMQDLEKQVGEGHPG